MQIAEQHQKSLLSIIATEIAVQTCLWLEAATIDGKHGMVGQRPGPYKARQIKHTGGLNSSVVCVSTSEISNDVSPNYIVVIDGGPIWRFHSTR